MQAMMERDATKRLTGRIEIDDAYLGGGGVGRGLWRDGGGRDGDRGCTEHDRARSEGIGAGRAVRADPATGSWAEENDLQGPDAAPRSRSAGRADDTR